LNKTNKVRHHCHITGNFLSAVCSNCNLKLKFRKPTKSKKHKSPNFFIPIALYNLRGYDSHIILRHLTRHFASRDVSVIATNMEKYMSFEINGLRFLDSLQFLNCSLDVLTKNLAKEGDSKFEHMCRLHGDEEQFKLLLRKGVYPYEYTDSTERMSETALPGKENFYSCLTEENITDADYQHAQKVWNKFNIHSTPCATIMTFILKRTSFYSPTDLKSLEKCHSIITNWTRSIIIPARD